jgi:hypothetical protein
MPLVPPQRFRKLDQIHRIGLAADKPAAADVLIGTLYHSSDVGTTERSDGTTWVPYFKPGLSSSVFYYRIDLTTTNVGADPGTGKLRYNNATQASSTIFAVDWITDDGFDSHALFLLFAPTTRFMMQDKDFANNYQLWELTSPATNHADFFTVPVIFKSSGGSGVFTNNTKVAVIILPPGLTV